MSAERSLWRAREYERESESFLMIRCRGEISNIQSTEKVTSLKLQLQLSQSCNAVAPQ